MSVTTGVQVGVSTHLNTFVRPSRTQGLDGKVYPSYRLPAADRDWLAGRVHYLSHDEHRSVRQIQAVLRDEHDQPRSVGWVSGILRNWRCDRCSGHQNLSPEQVDGWPPVAQCGSRLPESDKDPAKHTDDTEESA